MWKIKVRLANDYHQLAKSVGVEQSSNSLLPIYLSLLRDPESEVRVAAVQGLTTFIEYINSDKL